MPEREAAVNGPIADTPQIAVIDQRQPEHTILCGRVGHLQCAYGKWMRQADTDLPALENVSPVPMDDT